MTTELRTLILAESVPQAIAHFRDQIASLDSERLTGKFTSQRRFKIATREESLEGLRFSDVIVVGKVSDRMVANAKARLV